jgi:hypothetical protein
MRLDVSRGAVEVLGCLHWSQDSRSRLVLLRKIRPHCFAGLRMEIPPWGWVRLGGAEAPEGPVMVLGFAGGRRRSGVPAGVQGVTVCGT